MDLPLAVYGTLRPGCGGAEHLGIEEKIEYLEPCTLPGRLWLVRSREAEEIRLVPALYPEEEGIVQAHLLHVPEEVWGKIDRFEDFVPHDRESPYLREEIETLEGASAWVYRAQNIERINFLRGGDWNSYAHHPKAIPLFPAQQ